jgi:hypothetical protein
MCIVAIEDANQNDEFRFIDLGNYFLDSTGRKCLITSKELAEKYFYKVNVPIYTLKEKSK